MGADCRRFNSGVVMGERTDSHIDGQDRRDGGERSRERNGEADWRSRLIAARDWGGRVVVDPAGRDWVGLGHGFLICREEAMIGLLPGFMRINDQWPAFWDLVFRCG